MQNYHHWLGELHNFHEQVAWMPEKCERHKQMRLCGEFNKILFQILQSATKEEYSWKEDRELIDLHKNIKTKIANLSENGICPCLGSTACHIISMTDSVEQTTENLVGALNR